MKKLQQSRITIESPAGALKLRILQPLQNKKAPADTPAILWLHGGGYISGGSYMVYITRAAALVRRYGAVLVAPDYHLAPRHPYPAALDDAYAALRWLRGNAAALGADPARLMVGGESAGGGLAAALCMLARDRGEVSICFQMPLYPMLDDRDTPSSRDNRTLGWNTFWNHRAWKAYIGAPGQEKLPPYAAPARQTNYENLPPAYTFVADREPFYCETLDYIRALQAAGVPAAVDVYSAPVHAFDMLPWSRAGRRAAAEFERQYLRAAAQYRAEQPPQTRNA